MGVVVYIIFIIELGKEGYVNLTSVKTLAFTWLAVYPLQGTVYPVYLPELISRFYPIIIKAICYT